MDRLSKHVIGLLLLACSLFASAQSFYLDADPPQNWRSGDLYEDGEARILVGRADRQGIIKTGGAAAFFGPLSVQPHPVLAETNIYPDDPIKAFLWRITPGSTAHAYVPAAVYGMGVVGNAFIRAGGRNIVAPSFLKFSFNAGKDMARQTYRGAAVATVAGMLGSIGLAWVWDQVAEQWVKPSDDSTQSDGFLWCTRTAQSQNCGDGLGWFPSESAARAALLPSVDAWSPSGAPHYWDGDYIKMKNGTTYFLATPGKKVSTCPAGWYQTPAGCLQNPSYVPVHEPDFRMHITSVPWPADLPEQLPEGVPVENPVINPLPSPWDKPKPFFEPIGDPVKNPRFDPEKTPSTENPPRVQPGTEIQGSPTVSNPWRVTVIPVDKPIVTDEDIANPRPQPDGSLDPEDGQGPQPDSSNKPSERQPLLCEVFPWILACARLDTPEGPQLPTKDIEVTLTPDMGWGADNAACPAPRGVDMFGRHIPIPFDLFCTYMEGIRPVVLAMAWLSAAFILVGGFRQGD